MIDTVYITARGCHELSGWPSLMDRLRPFISSSFLALPIILLLIPPMGISDPLREYCQTSTYPVNGTFQSNLKALLSSIASAAGGASSTSSSGGASSTSASSSVSSSGGASNTSASSSVSASGGASGTGFANDSRGTGIDRVYGLSLCRGDIDLGKCQTCLKNATRDIASGCPQRKSATVWYDECLLRYSERNFFSSVDASYFFDINNPNSVSEPDEFGRSLGKLMDNLTTRAAYRRQDRMFAAGAVDLGGSRRLYGLVQCTRDLSGGQCRDCLERIRGRISTCCGRTEGGRLFSFNCFLRFELFQFFEAPDLLMISPSLLAPPPTTQQWAPSPTETGILGPSSWPERKIRRTGIGFILIISIAFFVVLAMVVGHCLLKALGSKKEDETRPESPDVSIGHAESTSFDLRTLRIATNNFSYENKLGEGGFGPVYKGVLPSGQQIAIKKLSRSSRQGLSELRNEIALVAKLQHRNLVRLLGYCLEEHENLLVYEYLPNRSLDKLLFDPLRRIQLNWEKRHKIIEGIARGLLYLHEDSRLKVIHRDLKVGSILLDGEMNPKISDFGLAKLFGIEQSEGNTSRVVGTHGYMPPEYVIHGHYSKKSDIYSFGIIVLEIITGRQTIKFRGSEGASTLTSYVWRHWLDEKITDMLDQSILEGCAMEQVSRCIHIGLLCVQEDPYCRPSIASVLLMLSGDAIALPPVSEPAFCAIVGTTTTSNSSSISQGIRSLGHAHLNNEIVPTD